MSDLKLKLIVHSGEALFNRVGRVAVLSGVDVIRLHRLTKNSVAASEYVLMSQAAFDDVGAPEGVAVEEGCEEYDIGRIRTHVYRPGTEWELDADHPGADDAVRGNVEVWRLQNGIRPLNPAVGEYPDWADHFNTRPGATLVLGYGDGRPERANGLALVGAEGGREAWVA